MAVKPSAVVFDLGKVLLDFDYSIVVRRVAARSRHAHLQAPELQRFIMGTPLLPAFERGELTSQEFFEAIREPTGFDGGFEEFAGYFADIFKEMPCMVALHEELRCSGVPTFIFSNTNDLAIQHIRRTFPFFGRFDGYVLSYEHGVMKPDAPLYEAVERLTGRDGPDLIYFDDLPENVDAGARRGWQAVLHCDPAKSRDRLRAVGLVR